MEFEISNMSFNLMTVRQSSHSVSIYFDHFSGKNSICFIVVNPMLFYVFVKLIVILYGFDKRWEWSPDFISVPVSYFVGYCFSFCLVGKQGKVAEYYKKQERLLEGFNEMESINESGCFPGSLTEVDCSFNVLIFLPKFIVFLMKFLQILLGTMS